MLETKGTNTLQTIAINEQREEFEKSFYRNNYHDWSTMPLHKIIIYFYQQIFISAMI